NTHRGAIWALGLLVSAVAMHGGVGSAQQVTNTAAKLAKLPDAAAPKVFSKGLRATHRYQVPGAREEAQQAFPHIMQRALPQLRLSRFNGSSETHARLDALMAIMTSLTDTCVLSRAGLEGLDAMQDGARAVLSAGGTAHPAGQLALATLDRQMLALNASPGGAADLLAATLFLDRIESPYLKH
ncbi:triphosphoribosyl-dephospho-CoA synthase MdcB, partial [Salmonella enterica subsp. salamae]|nr:triphosphoribosyl-dephospho-CoA synthase MdcB [Salmonella enterica subsp. salamae]